MTAVLRGVRLATFLAILAMLGSLTITAPTKLAAAVDDAPGGRFDSASLGVHFSWPAELTQVPPAEMTAEGSATKAAALVLRSKSGIFPTLNLIEVPGRFDLSRAAETVADSYRSVGLTDATVQRSTVLPSGWAELVLAYRGSIGPAKSYVLVIPRLDSHLVLTLVGNADAAEDDIELWRQIVASMRVDSLAPSALETGQARSVPAVWIVVLMLSAAAATATLMWHRKTGKGA